MTAQKIVDALLDTPPNPVECAWCIKELGLAPTPNATHGTCRRHALAQLSQRLGPERAAARLANVKSFCPDLAQKGSSSAGGAAAASVSGGS